MSLSNAWVQSPKKIPDVLGKIRDGQAPERFTNQLMNDWGFKSTNDRAFVPLLKSLNFLTADGVPTQRYHDYRDHSRSGVVLAEAIQEAYSDLFLIAASPSSKDKAAIQGKFKSFHNSSDNVASMMTNTFLKLVELANFDQQEKVEMSRPRKASEGPAMATPVSPIPAQTPSLSGLHYNIQIHLPATKDLEVYNAIFRSLKENLVE